MAVSLASGGSTQRNAGATPEINITPLVDVVLVLLIIFMVIAPALNEGAQIELPKVLTPDPKPRDISPITLLVLDDGTLLLSDQPVKRQDLGKELQRLHDQDPKRALLFKSDEKTKYRTVRDTFAAVQNIGFKGVLLKVTERKTPGS